MEEFKILNDKSADWATQKVKEEYAERDRLLELVNEKKRELDAQADEIKEHCENNTKFLRAALAEYFETVKSKETKTQKSYKLLSGTLVLKKPSFEYQRDDNALIAWLLENDKDHFVETTAKVKWADLKKTLSFDEESGAAYDSETGLLLDGITPVEKPAEFVVK